LANHLKLAEALDSIVYLPLRKAINNLYIHKVAKTVTIKTEQGRESVRDLFKTSTACKEDKSCIERQSKF
jgi:hypothetical protein